MNTCRLLKLAVLSLPMLLSALWAAPAMAGPEAELVARYPAKSIASVRQADTALDEVKPVREHIERLYRDEQADCYERFLVSSCLAEARDKRRKSLQAVRRVEVEAKAFLRKDKADERDRAVAERQAKAAGGGKTIPISGTARDGGDGGDGTDAANGANGANGANDAEGKPGSP